MKICPQKTSPKPKFTADEKVLTLIWEIVAKCEFQVLCYHGPLLYEAKILKSKKESGNYSYFVHYQVKTGWRRLICFRHIISCKNWCVTSKESLDDILFKKGWNKNWDEWVGETRIMKQVSKTQKTQKISLSMTPGARKLREAEETVAKPRGCE